MIETSRTSLVLFTAANAGLVLKYYEDNKVHLAPWEPIRDSGYQTLNNFKVMGEQSEKDFEADKEVRLVAFNKDQTQVLGVCNFTGIVKGPLQACFLGYSIDKRFEGQGLMTEILDAGIAYIFANLKLNRIMANYIPANEGSGAVLNKLGFEREGYARKYLKIAGKWQDHVLMSKLNE
ncbi:GCN5-related N-acetyltransferase [Marinomonas sp. MED121]|uniref:GNAT family N-acetyltransferase n=1 Tax=Marinomonas sp. MED121 TaxID=314277 RepID=UPI0000690A44|nr:GNAT family N-acetyltransferase [Marinomonas sp. MED121]EAQ64098.1 GCN5-related N-acetyltransferase [Marinomonas sp. MED121]